MPDSPNNSEFSRLADESGLAIAVVDARRKELSTYNNNSICDSLNPNEILSEKCAEFCGKALERSIEAGETVRFICHAGLECRAFATNVSGNQTAVIVGRTFTRSENYRRAAARATNGDWAGLPVSTLFGNVLLSGSTTQLDKTADKAKKIIGNSQIDTIRVTKPPVKKADAIAPTKVNTTFDEISERSQALNPVTPTAELFADPEPIKVLASTEASNWRSFYSSILTKEYGTACEAIVDFVATQYQLDSVAWLSSSEGKFEKIVATGLMQKSNINVGISTADERLLAAANAEMPLELGERRNDGSSSRNLLIFPLKIGEQTNAALASIDPVPSAAVRHQIARLCLAVAPKLEILRLRSEVDGRDTLVRRVRKFNESLRSVDATDFWTQITISSAELLQAERASLMVYDEATDTFQIKAVVGANASIMSDKDPGRRVSRVVFEKGQPIVVRKLAGSGLIPLTNERDYRSESFISSPVKLGDRKIAVINFTDKADGRGFDRRDLDLVQTITSQIAVAIDREELKEKAGEFEQLSVTDALTGLLNRRYIEERLMEEVKRSNRHGYPMSLLMLDVDHFKSYNDTYGHPEGDEALKLVANIIRETLRGADVAARYGGEEFAILLPQTNDDEAAMIAERIRSNIEHAKFPKRAVTASIGVASCSAELCSKKGLVDAADLALYDAKRRGRNSVKLFADMEIEIAQ